VIHASASASEELEHLPVAGHRPEVVVDVEASVTRDARWGRAGARRRDQGVAGMGDGVGEK
jgi:hypothetical protein